MTATKKLKAQMQLKGFSQTTCAEKLGISYQAFNNKLLNKVEFKASEIIALCSLLDIREQEIKSYFFCEWYSQNGYKTIKKDATT